MTAVISHTHISSVTNVYIYIYIYKHLARACLRVYGFPVGAHVTVKSSMCLPAGSAVYLQVVLVLKKLAGLIVCFFTCLWPSPGAEKGEGTRKRKIQIDGGREERREGGSEKGREGEREGGR